MHARMCACKLSQEFSPQSSEAVATTQSLTVTRVTTVSLEKSAPWPTTYDIIHWTKLFGHYYYIIWCYYIIIIVLFILWRMKSRHPPKNTAGSCQLPLCCLFKAKVQTPLKGTKSDLDKKLGFPIRQLVIQWKGDKMLEEFRDRLWRGSRVQGSPTLKC